MDLKPAPKEKKQEAAAPPSASDAAVYGVWLPSLEQFWCDLTGAVWYSGWRRAAEVQADLVQKRGEPGAAARAL